MVTRREQLLKQLEEGNSQDSAPEEGAEEGIPVGSVRRSVDREPPVSVVTPLVTESKHKKEKKSELPFDFEAKEKPAEKLSRGTRDERQAADIGAALHEKTVTLFAMLNGFLPVTSVYAIENSEKAVNALVSIGKRNPKILGYLSKAANGVDALEIGKFVVGILVAIQVDTGRANGDEMIARTMGVSQIMEEHFWTSGNYDVNESVLLQNKAPHFAPV